MTITASLRQRLLTQERVNIIVEVAPPALEQVRQPISTLGLTPFYEISVGGLAFLTFDNVPRQRIPEIEAIPGVEAVHFDFNRFELRFGIIQGLLQARAAGQRPRDFLFAPNLLQNLAGNVQRTPAEGIIGTEKVWQLGGGPAAQSDGIDGSKTKVAVIDTGAWSFHQALGGIQTASVSPFGLDKIFDSAGHGTWVTAEVSSPPNVSTSGVACRGMSRAQTLSVKALRTPLGIARVSDVLKAIQIAEDTFKPLIFSMSLGGKAEELSSIDPECKVIKNMTKAGRIFVVAAGNDGPDASTINSPGICPEAVTVGSVSITDRNKPSWFSSRGPSIDGNVKPDVAFYGGGRAKKESKPEEKLLNPTGYGSKADPSDRLIGFRPRRSYAALEGTSMSTPGVAGILALWNDKFKRDKGRALTRADVTSVFAAQQPKANDIGVGVINYKWLALPTTS